MGKRKERRVAAKISSGRRVKLDLFAEPSGDLGGSSAQDEAGGDNDLNNRAELPNSPSSSDNPLQLLEQYSDDELDEESSKGVNHAIVENSSAELEDQAKVAVGEEYEDGINAGKELDAQKVEELDVENGSASLDALQKMEENGATENNATEASDLNRERVSTEQISVPAVSDIHVTGDVSSSWKLVLHEDSNQYYYWNTVTSETSWEVPDVLAQGPELSCEQKSINDTEAGENASPGIDKSSSSMELDRDDSKAANPVCETKESNDRRPKTEVFNESKGNILDDKEGGHNFNRSDVKNSSDQISELYHVTSPGDHVSTRLSGDALLGVGCASGADSEKCVDDVRDPGEHETGTDFSSRLLKQGEHLLERLKSLKGSKGHLKGHDQILRYILEVEIRLSDIKSLLSHGSSLRPFWVHSERQLKQLEAAINNEVFQFYESAHTSEVEAYKSHASCDDGIEAASNEKKAVCYTSEDSHASKYVSIKTEVQKNSHDEEACDDGIINNEHGPSIGYPTTTSGSGAGGKVEVHGISIHAELTPNTVLHSEEDVDMDVDMEVEDTIPSCYTTGDASDPQHGAPPTQSIPPNQPAEHQSFASEEVFGIPPPPDEDWIPPPPPDNELFPPPPPDEPPEYSYPPPPSDSETLQPFPYTEQYNLSYGASSFECYGQTNTDISGSHFYTHAEGCEKPVSHPPIYYEAVPNNYPAATPVVVNPVELAAYYGLQDGIVPPVPVVNGINSYGFGSKSGPEILGSHQIKLVEAREEMGCNLLPNTEIDVPVGGSETEKPSEEVSSASASVQAPANESITLSTPTVTATSLVATATVPKTRSKVSRKKRTVAVVSTLRSDKKVSSLVDKWKAAKEELHDDDEEDEPENSYEMLEKKRQREIEEWRAQQIVSGAARDNANFQPLGGDWRKRVKRRKAQLANEAAVETPWEGVTDGNLQSNLNEFSKDLQSGWQAYWDESSKQVYYGNTSTSEATWIKPTN